MTDDLRPPKAMPQARQLTDKDMTLKRLGSFQNSENVIDTSSLDLRI